MAYTKQNFANGSVLYAEQLISMEDALIELYNLVGSGGTSTGGDGSCNIKYVESTDTSNLLNLRDFESGTYILSGKFRPYSGSTATISFANALLVNIITKTAGTHVQVFYPVNNCVQFLAITDDSYERTNVYLNDLIDYIGTLSSLTTTEKTNLVGAINEVKTLAESGVSDEQIASAVAAYLEENPVEGGGADGEDGYSPTASVEQTTDGAIITITDKDGTTTATITNGKDGVDGDDGEDGEDGYTPVRGTDYWTETDKTEIVNDVLAALPTWTGGSY